MFSLVSATTATSIQYSIFPLDDAVAWRSRLLTADKDIGIRIQHLSFLVCFFFVFFLLSIFSRLSFAPHIFVETQVVSVPFSFNSYRTLKIVLLAVTDGFYFLLHI